MKTENHTGLAKISPTGQLTSIVYYNSKFPREVGDRITYEGVPMVVIVVAVSRNTAILDLNYFIKHANAGLKFAIKDKTVKIL